MAPAAAEMLASLGLLDRVVGVGDFVRDPEPLSRLPRIGAYDAPNLERVLALRPDLYVTSASLAASQAHRQLRSLGLEVLDLDTSTYDGVLASLVALGSRVARPQAALELRQAIARRVDRVRSRAAGLAPRDVLVVVGHDPLYVAGPGSHLDEMLRLAGGRNLARDAPAPYPRFSMEAVLERMPEVIVDVSDNRPAARRGRIAGDWARFPFLPAVRQGRVYQVDPSRLTIPGIHLPEMTLLMGRLVHPEAFGEPRPHELGPGPWAEGG
jgi:iron complex transport system substrate-binding protein